MSREPQLERRAHEGATKVVRICLGLQHGEELVILTDETTYDVGDIVAKAAILAGVQPTIVRAPGFQQMRFREGAKLPLAIEAALRQGHAVATCLADASERYDFRIAVMNASHAYGRRLAHMPGISKHMLATAVNVDYERIVEQCDQLARVLAKGRTALLVTHDPKGRSYSLSLGLGGWDRTPVSSTGIIPDGAWGNVPGGETYIAPMEGSADGEVFVSGSVQGYPIPTGSGIKLAFRQGVLEDWSPKESRAARAILHARLVAEHHDDRSWSNLAELGIGLNPKTGPLTGIALLDEKKRGTAHIAIGDNATFGGSVHSAIHSDMVVLEPGLTVDSKPVLRRGRTVLGPHDWEERIETVEVEARWRDSFRAVGRSGIRTRVKGKVLLREWRSGVGRIGYMSVGSLEAAQTCADIYGLIPADGAVALDRLSKRAKLDPRTVLAALRIMVNYDVVKLV